MMRRASPGHHLPVDIKAQWVRTSWTKSSRGAPAATQRNAAPAAFVLPAIAPTLVHQVLMDENDGFQAHESVRRLDPEEVSLTIADDRLRVELIANPFGMPRRWRRPPAVRLAQGEWLRWQINYRFVYPSSGTWTYRLDTLNLAYGQVAPDTFLSTPTHYTDEQAPLR